MSTILLINIIIFYKWFISSGIGSFRYPPIYSKYVAMHNKRISVIITHTTHYM
jgi:putative component of membrane protein insertase Oxa1/YidC/SpoIIIJ protein YidD